METPVEAKSEVSFDFLMTIARHAARCAYADAPPYDGLDGLKEISSTFVAPIASASWYVNFN